MVLERKKQEDGRPGRLPLWGILLAFLGALGQAVGLVLSKLDCTSKGGAIVAISEKYKIPVRYIGLGEGVDDIEEFDPKQFAEALVEQ